MLSQSVRIMQNYPIWIHTVLLIILKQEDFYEDNADDVEKRLDTSNYECNRPLPKGKNRKVIGLMKDELICCSYAKNIFLLNE